ncbi:MAG: hypothetical protein MK105_18065, partial [Crocinitomicaceae bacterium]|nr:hypothetical protein [Crocinitomicaceae bacterium]
HCNCKPEITMKKPLLFFATISLSALMLVSINSNKNGGSYIKNAWSEISSKEDSTLFVPYGGWSGM